MAQRRPPHLYRKHFTRDERLHLAALTESDVASEIYLLRVFVARTFGGYGESLPADLKSQLRVLHTMGYAVSVIARLIRTQNITHNSGTKLALMLEEALDSLRNEWGL